MDSVVFICQEAFKQGRHAKSFVTVKNYRNIPFMVWMSVQWSLLGPALVNAQVSENTPVPTFHPQGVTCALYQEEIRCLRLLCSVCVGIVLTPSVHTRHLQVRGQLGLLRSLNHCLDAGVNMQRLILSLLLMVCNSGFSQTFSFCILDRLGCCQNAKAWDCKVSEDKLLRCQEISCSQNLGLKVFFSN